MEDKKRGIQKEIQAVIFDVDGTILDSMKMWEEVGVRYLRKKGIQAEENVQQILKDKSLEEGALYLKEQYSLPESKDTIIKGIIEEVHDFYYYEAEAKEGIKEVMELFYKEGVRMVIATASDALCVEQALLRLDLKKYIGRIFTCQEVGAGKTKPNIYLAASKWLSAEPGHTCVFEDVLYAAKTAKKAGFQVVGVYDSTQKEDERKIREIADDYIKSWTELYENKKMKKREKMC